MITPRLGLGMIVNQPQRWITSPLPWSLALRNTVHTGLTYDTPSHGTAIEKFWASQGMQGYAPRRMHGSSAGMDGLGCGCGCGGGSGCSEGSASPLLWLLAGGAAAYFLLGRRGITWPQ